MILPNIPVCIFKTDFADSLLVSEGGIIDVAEEILSCTVQRVVVSLHYFVPVEHRVSKIKSILFKERSVMLHSVKGQT